MRIFLVILWAFTYQTVCLVFHPGYTQSYQSIFSCILDIRIYI